jgi:hypothetical protein
MTVYGHFHHKASLFEATIRAKGAEMRAGVARSERAARGDANAVGVSRMDSFIVSLVATKRTSPPDTASPDRTR